ncbi:MAG: apolipoprotein N-acyltransferase [Pseudomonadota bacterium]
MRILPHGIKDGQGGLFPKKVLCAILSGLMLTASFPPGGLEWLIWFSLFPLLKTLGDTTPSQSFRLGLVTGLTHYLTLHYWVIIVLQKYGGLNILISLGALVMLCFYLALYPAVFSCFYSYARRSRFLALTSAGAWVGLEYVKGNALTGFPWCLLGYTQYRNLDLIQIADLVGVYGLSFLVVLSNVLICILFSERALKKKALFPWETAIALLMATFTFVYGHDRLIRIKELQNGDRPSVKIVVVQGNVDQSIKWDPAYQEETMRRYLSMTLSARPFRPYLIVWPETAAPFFFQENTDLSHRISLCSKMSNAWLLFGSPAYEREEGRVKYYNRAYLLSPDGELSGFYDKSHLVPFGEYVPLQRFFPFINHLVQAAGDFASGDKTAPLRLSSFSAGVLICYEVIFPELGRRQTRDGAGILVNLTNDAWFGMTSAPYQHLSMAVLRAVENRRPLVRAANTGISAIIGPEGKIISQSDLFMEEVLKNEVRLGDSSCPFYSRYGDFFPMTMLILSLIKILYILCYNKLKFRTPNSLKAL